MDGWEDGWWMGGWMGRQKDKHTEPSRGSAHSPDGPETTLGSLPCLPRPPRLPRVRPHGDHGLQAGVVSLCKGPPPPLVQVGDEVGTFAHHPAGSPEPWARGRGAPSLQRDERLPGTRTCWDSIRQPQASSQLPGPTLRHGLAHQPSTLTGGGRGAKRHREVETNRMREGTPQ